MRLQAPDSFAMAAFTSALGGCYQGLKVTKFCNSFPKQNFLCTIFLLYSSSAEH